MRRALWTLATLLSHWRRHPMQLATLLIGLISATALWSGVQALNQQARSSYDRAAATFGGARTPALISRNGATLPQHLGKSLERYAYGVVLAAVAGVPLGLAMGWFRWLDDIVTPIFDGLRVVALSRLARQIPIADELRRYGIALVLATHPENEQATEMVRK